MRIPKPKARRSVARPTYPTALLSPLGERENPATKLPVLLEALGVTTYRKGVVAMLIAHVIGHNVRDYPRELRGSPVEGPSADARVGMLLKHVGAEIDREGLLAMAVRHLPGFKPAVQAAVGRKSALAKRGFDRNWFEAVTQDEYGARFEDARKQQKNLSQLQWARRVVSEAATDPDDPLHGVKPEQVVKLLSEKKRRDLRLEKEAAERVRKLRKVAGLPPLKK